MNKIIEEHFDENGYWHREDGPAIIFSDGTQEWWYNNKHITDEIIHWAKERDIDHDNMSDIDKMALKFSIKDFVK